MKCALKDTCSTYCLRVVKNYHLKTSLKLLYGRLIQEPCSNYALYNIRGYLFWGDAYEKLMDLPTWVSTMLDLKKELPSTVQRILSNFYIILCYQNLPRKAEVVKLMLDELHLSLEGQIRGPIIDFFKKSTQMRIRLFTFSIIIFLYAILAAHYWLILLSTAILIWVRKSAKKENVIYKRFLLTARTETNILCS